VTNDDGTSYEGEYGMGDLLENGGDVSEAVEEMYGMIWFLAAQLSRVSSRSFPAEPPRGAVMELIVLARDNYRDGVRLGRGS
jgi:hypothetical protein